MLQWAQLSFLLKDVVQTLKVISIVSLPIALVITIGILIVIKRLKKR
jgi:hypothetical protein